MLEDWITETGRVPRTLRLDGAKEFVGSEMRDFCRKHNITLQLVPTYNHLLQCRVKGAIRITKSHTRVVEAERVSAKFVGACDKGLYQKEEHDLGTKRG